MIFSYKQFLIGALLLALGTSISLAQTLDDSENFGDPSLTLPPASLTLPSLYNENDIFMRTSPENPQAFQPVTLTLTSNIINVTQYPITWSVNEQGVSTGTGMRSFQTQTKDYNQPVTVTATIKHTSGDIIKSITLLPSDIPLTWEAVDAYVPPFYQGKKLAPREGTVRVIALPGSLSAGATYRWERNGTTVIEASGYEKNTFTLKHNRVRATESIGLTTTTSSGARSEKKITLSFVEPFILFHQQDSQTGLRSRQSLNQFTLTQPKLFVEAVPYFFSKTTNLFGKLQFLWGMNNSPISNQSSPNPQLLLLNKPEGAGVSLINLRVTNPGFILQSAESSLRVQFR